MCYEALDWSRGLKYLKSMRDHGPTDLPCALVTPVSDVKPFVCTLIALKLCRFNLGTNFQTKERYIIQIKVPVSIYGLCQTW